MFDKNPTISQNVLNSVNGVVDAPMTINGAIYKTFFLLLIMFIPAIVTWQQFNLGYMDKVNALMMGGLIIGFVTALIIIFKQNLATYLSPVYAFAEGAFLGGLSATFEAMYPGIAIQAIALTMLTALASLFLYKTGVIKVTEKFRSALMTAMVGILLLYLANLVATIFFHNQLPYLFSSNPIGIAFSVIVVIVAALSLIPNFDFIEKGSQMMLPKYMEWYSGFGILVTLVWLYVEVLRLVAKLRDNNR